MSFICTFADYLIPKMENRKRNYGENKPERGQSPYKRKEIKRSSDSHSKRRFNNDSEERPRRDYSSERRDDNPRRRFNNNSEERPRRDYSSDRRDDNPRRRFNNNSEERPRRDYSSERRDDSRESGEKRPRKDFRENRFGSLRKDSQNRDYSERKREYSDKRNYNEERPRRRRDNEDFFEVRGNSHGYDEVALGKDGLIRLNKYIANSGICSRREADELIKAGAVTVNGEVVTEMGHKISLEDIVVYGGEKLVNERKKYLLLNKPKGYITTMDDPRDRKTVLSLIGKACKERLYPVGRLDRNTTGLLLFTNDGEMTKKLTHPSFGAKKIYHVELDKPLTHADMQSIMDGIELEDGMIAADEIQYVGDGEDKRVVGIELHSGKNRIVRRIFAALGYDVYKLDRVAFASLTKKNLPRGMYRFLSDKEVAFLKMLKTN